MGRRMALITMCALRKRLSLGARGRVACYRQGRKIPDSAYKMIEILQETWRRRDKKIE